VCVIPCCIANDINNPHVCDPLPPPYCEDDTACHGTPTCSCLSPNVCRGWGGCNANDVQPEPGRFYCRC
jgi:hypothetical protein